ncbi:hypothetical protein LJB88_01005, partial [Erysipelotrichaceae bacterium OttesenSCG-928-M19]|nr:hypothetical protein [Erysipelotrichaceae bacterium OttesenSCG-928-M19]
EKNDMILRLLIEYNNALIKVGEYQNDKDMENKSIIAFSEFLLFLEDELKYFTEKCIIDFSHNTILANINIKRMKTAKNLYDKYIHYYDDYEKGRLFKNMFLLPSGSLDYYNEFLPWFTRRREYIEYISQCIQDADNEEDKNKALNKKLNYMSNLIGVTSIEVFDLSDLKEEYIQTIKEIHGKNTMQAFNFINYCMSIDFLKSDIIEWLSTINNIEEEKNSFKKNVISRIASLYSDSSKQIIIEEYLHDGSFNSRYSNMVKMARDRNVTRQKLYQESLEVFELCKDEIKGKKKRKSKLRLLKQFYSIKKLIRYYSFWSKYNDTLDKVKPVENSDTIYLFVNDYSLVNSTLALPLLMQAKLNNCIVASTSPRIMNHTITNDEELNDLLNVMDSDKDIRHHSLSKKWHYDWKIDIDNFEISYNGINIYQPIYEFVSRYQFTFFLDYEGDAFTKNKVIKLVSYMDRVIYYCEQLKEYAMKNNKRIRFISNAPHFPHAASYRIYCEAVGYKADMNFIVISHGYDNYFKNIGDAQTETLTALNLTKNLNSRNSFLGTKEGFEAYYKNNYDKLPELKRSALEWLSVSRSVEEIDSSNSLKIEILNHIKRYKKEGKKVYLLNGKVIFDLCVKDTKGCCHRDMSDWITHTVETVNKNKEILLLIKPHPHEQRKDITMTSEPTITLKDIIKTNMEENVIYLDNSMFKNQELLDYVDLGIMWNGTSSLELAAQNIKTVICDKWGQLDYPIGFIKTNTKDEYESLLNNPDSFEMDKELQDKAIVFLNYMASSDVCFTNPYTTTSTLNYFQFTNSKIYGEEIDKLIKNGNSDLYKLLDVVTN